MKLICGYENGKYKKSEDVGSEEIIRVWVSNLLLEEGGIRGVYRWINEGIENCRYNGDGSLNEDFEEEFGEYLMGEDLLDYLFIDVFDGGWDLEGGFEKLVDMFNEYYIGVIIEVDSIVEDWVESGGFSKY